MKLLATPITDEQWTTITKSSGLLADARSHVEYAIEFYRTSLCALKAAKTPAKTKQSLALLVGHINGTVSELKSLAENPHAMMALARVPGLAHGAAMPSRHDQATDSLQQLIIELARWSDWFAVAASNVASGAPGVRREPLLLNLLVQQLDGILQTFLNKPISRTNKGRHTPRDFVSAVCKIADPSIGRASIDEAMKRIIRTRGEFVETKTR